MATVKTPFNLQDTKMENLPAVLTRFLKDLMVQINGGLNFNTNISSSQLLTFNFTVANSDTTVFHGMNRSPTGFIVVNASAAMQVFQGNAAWSASTITLQSNAVGTAMIYAI